MFDAFLRDLYLFAPAFLANAMPVIAKKLPLLRRWDTPINARILGKNKTIRGLTSGIVGGTLLALLQHELNGVSGLPDISHILTSPLRAALIGALLGAGALLGDIVESSLKRKMGIPPGEAFPVVDGIDYILGALILLSVFYIPSLRSIILLLMLAPLASLVANMIAFTLGWKRQWY